MKIYFFGDSICFGQDISIHKIWVAQISRQLEKDFPEQDIIVANPSINGNTTRQALERMSYDVLVHQPDILYIQFGLNDCNFWKTDFGSPRVYKDNYIANLREMIHRALVPGVKRVILNSNHPTNKGQEYDTQNQDYYNAFKSENFNENCIILDVRNHIEQDLKIKNYQDFLFRDGIHLNSDGHTLYFNYIYPEIKNIVSRIYDERVDNEFMLDSI